MEEMDLRTTGMAWEWGAADIDDDEDDGKDWVPTTPRTLATAGNRPSMSTAQPREEPVTPFHSMAVYAIEPSRSGGMVQIEKLTHITVRTPQTQGETTIKGNLGK